MIFKIGNSEFRLSFSFVAITTIMIILCNEKIIVLSLVSSFLHECGHLFFIYVTGDIPEKVEFTLFGMRIERADNLNLSYKKEVLIASGGIIFNLLFSTMFYILYRITDSNNCLLFSSVNLVVAAVNSFPVYVLDCGRVLQYIILLCFDSDKSEKIVAGISNVFVLIFVVFSAFYIINYSFNISLIAVNLYLIFITIIKKWS